VEKEVRVVRGGSRQRVWFRKQLRPTEVWPGHVFSRVLAQAQVRGAGNMGDLAAGGEIWGDMGEF